MISRVKRRRWDVGDRFQGGDEVEVFRVRREEWARGRVRGHRVTDGVDEYFVQLDGYHLARVEDETSWFRDDAIRPR